MPAVPSEIYGHIVDTLRPENPDKLLSPSDEITKAWLSMAATCKALYNPAARALRDHCVYLNTRKRAQTFDRCLKLSPPSFRTGQGLRGVKSMFVASFPEGDGFDPAAEVISEDLAARAKKITFPKPVEADPRALQDDSEDDTDTAVDSPLDDLNTVMALHDIFQRVGPTLTRLVIDMPLRSLWIPDDTKAIKKVLWCGFVYLRHLEEFTTVRDELFLLDRRHGGSWDYSAWPNLRRLSLYNPELEAELWEPERRTTWFDNGGLNMLVCARADAFRRGVDLFRQIYGDAPPIEGSEVQIRSPGELTMVHVDVKGMSSMAQDEPSSRLHLVNKVLPRPEGPGFEEDASTWPTSPGDLVQEAMLRRALEGTLWEWAGDGIVVSRLSDEEEEEEF